MRTGDVGPGVYRKELARGAEVWYVRGAGGAVPLYLHSDIPIPADHPLVEALHDYLDELPRRTIRRLK